MNKYALGFEVDKLTHQLYYGICTEDLLDIPPDILHSVYTSYNCVLNEMVRTLGTLLGPEYVTPTSLYYWRTVLQTKEFKRLYNLYIVVASNPTTGTLHEWDSLRPTVESFTPMDNTHTEFEGLCELGVGLRILRNVDVGAQPHPSPKLLCPECGAFKSATPVNFYEHELLYSDAIAVCAVCYDKPVYYNASY